MELSAKSRRITALFALVSVLYMPLVMAVYACPSLDLQHASETAALAMAAGHPVMSGCEGMDMEQPGLCHAHDQAGNRSLDKPELPHVAPFMPTGLVLAVSTIDMTVRPIAVQPQTSPPLPIRNCCFRI